MGRIIGYTLLTIFVIGVLAAIALPNFIKAGHKSNNLANVIGSAPSAGGTHVPNNAPYDLTYFENYGTNPFISTEDENTSTFGMDVDTASYTIARRFLLDGYIPDPDSVRVEEFINYFNPDYPQPSGDDVFSISIDGAESEFGQPNYHLLRIGIQGRDVSMSDRPPANMIFVIDVSQHSGSDPFRFRVLSIQFPIIPGYSDQFPGSQATQTVLDSPSPLRRRQVAHKIPQTPCPTAFSI